MLNTSCTRARPSREEIEQPWQTAFESGLAVKKRKAQPDIWLNLVRMKLAPLSSSFSSCEKRSLLHQGHGIGKECFFLFYRLIKPTSSRSVRVHHTWPHLSVLSQKLLAPLNLTESSISNFATSLCCCKCVWPESANEQGPPFWRVTRQNLGSFGTPDWDKESITKKWCTWRSCQVRWDQAQSFILR